MARNSRQTHGIDGDEVSPLSSPTTQGRIRPISMDFSLLNPKNSMIYSLLPSAVQSRLPRLGSFRKTMCTYGMDAEMEEGESSRGCKTPVQEYTSEIVLREPTPETPEYGTTGYFEEGEYKGVEKVAPARQQLVERESGIDWKFANQGINLISLSVQESATISRDIKYGNVPFARQLYVHGLTYLLRGLPSDLTPAEQLSIHGCIPQRLLQTEDVDKEGEISVSSHAERHATRHPQPPSILHKLLASTIVQLFVLFQFLFPYIKFFLRAAYEYEREHHISEKVLASSIDMADAFGKQSLTVTAALFGMGNGRMGEVLGEAASWVIKGITGGIHEGVGEGLNVIGVKRPG